MTSHGEIGDRARILIVDDVVQNVELLRAILTVEGYEVISASNGEEALAKVQYEQPDLLLLDDMMPNLDGYKVCSRLKGDSQTRLIPVVMVTSAYSVSDNIKGFEAGIDDFLFRPVRRIELLARVRSLIKAKRLNDELINVESIILALARAIEAKDPYTEGHIERVAAYATSLSKYIRLPHKEQDLMRKASILHDVGKIGVKESVLFKPGPLDPEELEHVKTHTIIGERICQPFAQSRLILDVVRHHHERYDGKGYPDGLSTEDIPLGARIMAVTDSFDALISDRPYRKRLSLPDAFTTLINEAGKQFDPELVMQFIKMIEAEQMIE